MVDAPIRLPARRSSLLHQSARSLLCRRPRSRRATAARAAVRETPLRRDRRAAEQRRSVTWKLYSLNKVVVVIVSPLGHRKVGQGRQVREAARYKSYRTAGTRQCSRPRGTRIRRTCLDRSSGWRSKHSLGASGQSRGRARLGKVRFSHCAFHASATSEHRKTDGSIYR